MKIYRLSAQRTKSLFVLTETVESLAVMKFQIQAGMIAVPRLNSLRLADDLFDAVCGLDFLNSCIGDGVEVKFLKTAGILVGLF